MKTSRRAARVLTCGGACILFLTTLVGCEDRRWASRESPQGKALERISAEKAAIEVEVPPNLPYQFGPVQVEKRYSDRNGTQFRAVLAWKLTGSRTDVEAIFTSLHSDPTDRRLEAVVFRLTYRERDGTKVGYEDIRIDLDQQSGTVVLTNFGKQGEPRVVTVVLHDAFWAESAVDPAEGR